VFKAVAPVFSFELTLLNKTNSSLQIEVRINPAGEVVDAKIVSGTRLDRAAPGVRLAIFAILSH